MTRYSLLCAALLTIAACGGSSESTTSTTASAAVTEPAVTEPAVTEPAVTEPSQPTLTAIQDIVLAAGDRAIDAETIAQAIVANYPTLTVSGSAVTAEPSTISLFINLLSSKDGAGPDNPWVVAVALMDTSGNCVGGGVYGFPLPTVTIDSGSPAQCNAGLVADDIGALI